jgi:hypothetical protein
MKAMKIKKIIKNIRIKTWILKILMKKNPANDANYPNDYKADFDQGYADESNEANQADKKASALNKNENKYPKKKNETETDTPDINRPNENKNDKIKIKTTNTK